MHSLRSSLALFGMVLLPFASGCAAEIGPQKAAQSPKPAPAAKVKVAAKHTPAEPAKKAAAAPELVPMFEPGVRRQVGDRATYRFSGAYRKSPLVLTQEVVGVEGEVLLVDMTFATKGESTVYRVRTTGQQVISAVRKVGAKETPVPLEKFEAILAETAFAADENQGLVSERALSLKVGGQAYPAQERKYRVRVKDRGATLRISHSDQVGWGDMRAEMLSSSGKVLYRAELVELHAADGQKAVASRR